MKSLVSCFPYPVIMLLEVTTLYPILSRPLSTWACRFGIKCCCDILPHLIGARFCFVWHRIVDKNVVLTPYHPSGHTELCHLLLVAVTLRLVAELLRQEPHLGGGTDTWLTQFSHLVVVQSLHSYPPFGFVFSDCDVGHFEASGVDMDFRLSLHFYVALWRPIQSPNVILGHKVMKIFSFL